MKEGEFTMIEHANDAIRFIRYGSGSPGESSPVTVNEGVEKGAKQILKTANSFGVTFMVNPEPIPEQTHNSAIKTSSDNTIEDIVEGICSSPNSTSTSQTRKMLDD